jgi:predicted DNA-binding ribbon-helix-helix protein
VSEERHTTCVQLPEATWQALKEIADRKGITVSDVIRNVIDTYIFIAKITPPRTDIDALERMVIVAFEMLKASQR